VWRGIFDTPSQVYFNPANGTLYTTFLGKVMDAFIPELLIPGTFHPSPGYFLLLVSKYESDPLYFNPANGTLYTTFLGKVMNALTPRP
jgi:hypothetical protein